MSILAFDAHVHFRNCFDLNEFLSAGVKNLMIAAGGRESGGSFLLLSESADETFFPWLTATDEAKIQLHQHGYQYEETEESCSLILHHPNASQTPLVIVSGQQIVTREKLEVLGLGIECGTVPDGLEAGVTIEQVVAAGGLAVLPWGAGKWLGSRGKLVEELCSSWSSEKFFLGDNGNRPVFWPRPKLFGRATSRNIGILPGTDPLPLKEEHHRVGSFGGLVEGEWDEKTPWTHLSQFLTSRQHPVTPFGRNQGVARFFLNQVRIRM